MTRFVLGSTTLQFDCDPVRPARRRVDLRQQREHNTEGQVIVYGKGAKIALHTIDFPRVAASVYTSLVSFIERTCRGSRHTFTWYDHEDTARTVRLVSPSISATPNAGGSYRLTIALEELL